MLEIYLTGIKPHSGLTLVTGGIAATMQSLGYSTAVYLPAQTGAYAKGGKLIAPDMLFMKYMDKNIATCCSYLYRNKRLSFEVFEEEKLQMEKEVIERDYKSICREHECLITNGFSDLDTPIGTGCSEEVFLQTSGLPVVLLASLRNSTLQDILDYLIALKPKNLNIRGIILNECPTKSEAYDVRRLQKTIETCTNATVLGIIPKIENIKNCRPEDFICYVLGSTDLEGIFNVKIPKLTS